MAGLNGLSTDLKSYLGLLGGIPSTWCTALQSGPKHPSTGHARPCPKGRVHEQDFNPFSHLWLLYFMVTRASAHPVLLLAASLFEGFTAFVLRRSGHIPIVRRILAQLLAAFGQECLTLLRLQVEFAPLCKLAKNHRIPRSAVPQQALIRFALILGPNTAYVANDPINYTDPTGECSFNTEGQLVGLCPNGDRAETAAETVSANGSSFIEDLNKEATERGVLINVGDSPPRLPAKTMANEDSGRLVVNIMLGGTDAEQIINAVPSSKMFPTEADVFQMVAPLDEILFHEGKHGQELMRGILPNDTTLRSDPGAIMKLTRPALVGPLMRSTTAPEKSAIDATNEYRALKGVPYIRIDHQGTLRVIQ